MTSQRSAFDVPGGVRAVLFDLDDTLFDHRHCARASLHAVHGRHECFRSLPFDRFEHEHAGLLESLHQEVLAGRMDVDAARIERFRRLFMSAGLTPSDAMVREAALAYRRAYVEERRSVAGAADLLARVRTRAAVVVVTNNVVEEQRQKLRHCGLAPLVDELVVSEEEGVAKPDPAIFLRALARVRCSADEAVMLGDSWPADIMGARAAGIRAIWFNRNGLPRPEAADEVVEVRSLEPVDEVLRVIFGGARTQELHAHRR